MARLPPPTTLAVMHPIERLRHVARAGGVAPSTLVHEAATALAGFGGDPVGLVTACRRLIDRHPGNGPLWWLTARVLCSDDPVGEAWRAAEEVEDDQTPGRLSQELPENAVTVVLGWPEQASTAMRRRGDLDLRVIDVFDEGRQLVSQLSRIGVDAWDVPLTGLGSVVAEADVVVLEAVAAGPSGILAVSGSRAAAALARHAGVPVWAVVGVGRVLPGRLWDALAARLEEAGDPWEAEEEFVPLDLLDVAVGPGGKSPASELPTRADCPIAPELLKGAGPT